MDADRPALSDTLRDFLAEAEETIDELSGKLSELAELHGSGVWNPDLLNAIFRDAHSLKGLAGMFGYPLIAETAHHAENLLDWLRLGKVTLSSQVLELLFSSVELLTSLLRAAADNTLEQHTVDTTAFATAVADCYRPATTNTGHDNLLEQLQLTPELLQSLTEYELHRLAENCRQGRSMFVVHVSLDLADFDQTLMGLTDILKSNGELISTLPGVSGQGENCIDFDLLVGTELTEGDLSRQLRNLTVSISQVGSSQPDQSSTALMQAAEQAAAAAVTSETTAVQPPDSFILPDQIPEELPTARSMSRTVRVDISKLDAIMQVVGELVLAHAKIDALAVQMRTEGFSRAAVELGKAAKGLERRLGELQRGVMDIRMVPVGQLYEKMGRIVRKTSRELGKKVILRLLGAETELDKLIVEDLADPLMHIIRNAIDHGIESPERRRAADKEEQGTLVLSSYQRGNHVVVEVADDGCGIDLDKVRQKALEQGLVRDIHAVSDQDAMELIFHPGFSTADQVTDISGRGVGMDVVRTNIAAVSGIVEVASWPGRGTRFTITLPMTLAIIKALVVFCAGRTYALPVSSVLETVLLSPEDIRTVEGAEVLPLRDQTLPLLRLEQVFNLERHGACLGEQYVVVVAAADRRLGLMVDDLVGQQDIVIKSLGTVLSNVRGIAGAADLGDQRTILVLDAAGIIDEAIGSGGGRIC